MHGSKNRWYEVEFTSKKLNARLAELVQLRRDVDRREVSAIVDEFVEWCSNVVMPFKVRAIFKDPLLANSSSLLPLGRSSRAARLSAG